MKNDLVICLLIFSSGVVIYEFASAGSGAGGFFMNGMMHATSHYIGAALAIIFGLVGLAMYKKVNIVTVGISVLSLILGIVFLLDAPGMVLYPVLTPHGGAMAGVGRAILLIGLIGMVASIVPNRPFAHLRPKTRNTAEARLSVCQHCGWQNPPENDYCGKCAGALRDQTRVY